MCFTPQANLSVKVAKLQGQRAWKVANTTKNGIIIVEVVVKCADVRVSWTWSTSALSRDVLETCALLNIDYINFTRVACIFYASCAFGKM